MKTNLENAVTNEYNRILLMHQVLLTSDVVPDVLKLPVHAFTKFLGLKKNREDNGGTGLVLRDEKGNFIIAGVVKYHEPEKEDQAGNWSYEFTFNEEDVKDCTNYNVTDSAFMQVLEHVATNHNLQIHEMDFAYDLIVSFFVALKNVLEQNASANEEFEIESENYFIAVSTVEGDQKLLSMIPCDEMKRLIKDDSKLEINN